MGRRSKSAPSLRDAVAQAARRAIDESGPDGLTVRRIAADAGASPNAPYIYFPGGQRELLAVVALEGFEELITVLERRPAAADSRDRVRERMLRYVRFGVEYPNLYRGMFSSQLAETLSDLRDRAKPGYETFAALQRIKANAYMTLIAPLEELGRAEHLREREVHQAPGLALAALAHGLVGEFIDEGLAPTTAADPWTDLRRRTTSDATDILLYGLLRSSAPLKREGKR